MPYQIGITSKCLSRWIRALDLNLLDLFARLGVFDLPNNGGLLRIVAASRPAESERPASGTFRTRLRTLIGVPERH